MAEVEEAKAEEEEDIKVVEFIPVLESFCDLMFGVQGRRGGRSLYIRRFVNDDDGLDDVTISVRTFLVSGSNLDLDF